MKTANEIVKCEIAMIDYERSECAAFCKVAEKWGGFSNMAGGYPLLINGISIRTSEALYQACRFPKDPEVQRLIIDQKSPMSAKMVGKPYRDRTRADWDDVRVPIMRWCLRLKLVQHWDTFGALLRESGELPIVEISVKDDFWGARPVGELRLVGQNVLGLLLVETRDLAQSRPAVTCPDIEDFRLFGESIRCTVATLSLGGVIQP
jgi:ribA/ribD-fused uncharacterized protein